MVSDLLPASGRHRATAGLLLAGVLIPALCVVGQAGVAGPLIALPAALAVAACLVRWQPGHPWLGWAVGAAPAFSLFMDVAFRGLPGLVVLWGCIEGPALLVLLVRVLRRAPMRQAVAVGALTGLAVLVLPLRLTLQQEDKSPWLGWALVSTPLLFLVGCFVAVGLYLRAMDARRARAVHEARRHQRLEVARDLHDFVAHEVTGIVLEAQAAQLADLDPAQARRTFADIENTGLRALSSMDRTIQALRDPADEGAPTQVLGLRDLPEVARRFTRTGGAEAHLDMAADLPDSVPPEVDATAYRVVVEALTNVRRHAADATAVHIAVTRTDEGVTLSVSDDGRGGTGRVDGLHRHGGTGLIGLGEQVTALGGHFVAGPAGTGWQIRAELPVAGARRG